MRPISMRKTEITVEPRKSILPPSERTHWIAHWPIDVDERLRARCGAGGRQADRSGGEARPPLGPLRRPARPGGGPPARRGACRRGPPPGGPCRGSAERSGGRRRRRGRRCGRCRRRRPARGIRRAPCPTARRPWRRPAGAGAGATPRGPGSRRPRAAARRGAGRGRTGGRTAVSPSRETDTLARWGADKCSFDREKTALLGGGARIIPQGRWAES